jgi:hypothetical protein
MGSSKDGQISYDFIKSGNRIKETGIIAIARVEDGKPDFLYKNKEYYGALEVSDKKLKGLADIANEIREIPEGSGVKFNIIVHTISSGSLFHGESPNDKKEVSKSEFLDKLEGFITQSVAKDRFYLNISKEEYRENDSDREHLNKFVKGAMKDGLTKDEIKGLKLMGEILRDTAGTDVSKWDKQQQENYEKARKKIEGAETPEISR